MSERTKRASNEHPYVPTLREQLAEGRIDRRDFLRTATLLGVSAAAAYGMAGLSPAKAASLPKGGTIRIAMRLQDITSPHTYAWVESSNVARQVLEYLTITGQDNVTRPLLAESWEASEDLKTWTIHLRKNVTWRDGRAFVADDVIWNLKRALDPATGSSMVGLVKSYLLEEYETAEKDDKGNPKKSTRLWAENAIEKIDDHTIRFNCKAAQLAVPEHMFHYVMLIMDPASNGVFGPGANGTGPFELVSAETGRSAKLKRRDGYWGEPAHVEALEFIDTGDDSAALLSALASGQVHGCYSLPEMLIPAAQKLSQLKLYDTPTALTAVARFKVGAKPFDDPRVRKAMRLAIDNDAVLKIALGGVGVTAEHHHVCPIHPEYASAPMPRDIDGAKKLLAEAGYPEGFETEIHCKPDPDWEQRGVQAMVQMWKEIGVRVAIKLLPAAQFWDVWTKVPFGFTTWTHRPLGTMTLSLAYRTGVPWNESDYSNPEFDKLLDQAEGTLDVEARRKIMAELEHIMQEDGPIVQPIWRKVGTAFDSRVQGVRMHPTAYIFGWELAISA